MFSKPHSPEPEGPDRLREIAAEKVAAANRLSAAIAEMGAAAEALFDADRAFCSEWLERHGNTGHGASRLMRQFRPFLLCDLELNAPQMLKYLEQPRQSRAKAQTIASQIARQVENDLAAVPQPKEPAQ
ncbi:MAG: hypothetical protein B7X90_08680 [Novosphingobium sp. 17-62-19]|nr:MAG: hypothetical protein B7Y74_00125 [Novosphingobium sp. 35-62-5]OZA19468.1 MAG: hypothetical protein B7X90_08680 [Novosphingobium sp. 17-62-19]